MTYEITAIRNHIVFQFLDGFSKRGVKQFEDKLEWGFTVVRHKDSVDNPRWVNVIAVGHEVDSDIQPGMHVLVEPLKWSQEFEVDGQKYWRTDNTCVMAIEEHNNTK